MTEVIATDANFVTCLVQAVASTDRSLRKLKVADQRHQIDDTSPSIFTPSAVLAK
jgi:hypothetical protein